MNTHYDDHGPEGTRLQPEQDIFITIDTPNQVFSDSPVRCTGGHHEKQAVHSGIRVFGIDKNTKTIRDYC